VAKKKTVETFSDDEIVFELDHIAYQLLRLNPKRMEVTLRSLDDKKEVTLPFAHLPKAVKKKIRPL
jgi:hypothetical protein